MTRPVTRAPLLHLQSAACGRATPGTVQAMVDHLALEVTEGSYVAEDLVSDLLERARSDAGLLLGVDAGGIALVGGATAGLLTLLAAWPLPAEAEVGVLPGEWAPNVDAFTHHGLRPRRLAVDDDGVLDLDAIARTLRGDPPALVHLTHLASHRGLVQPVAEAQALCRDAGVPLWVDVAQSFAHLDTTAGFDASYAPARKWLAGPRGVGVLAVAAPWRDRLRPYRPAQLCDVPAARLLEPEEAPVAARVGLAHALRERLETGADLVRDGLAGRGEILRGLLDGAPDWELADAPGAIGALVSLRPTSGHHVGTVRDRLLAEHRVLATACLPWRAPADMTGPLLRLAPHLDASDADLERAVGALREVTGR